MNWKHYIALGDSLTAGVGDEVSGIESIGWADRFAYAVTPHQYTNLARRGNTSDDLITHQLPVALKSRPDLVSLLIGGNDVNYPEWQLANFRSNYRAIVGAIKGMGATLVTTTMVNIIPLIPAPYLPLALPTLHRITEVNDVIREVSHEYNTIFVDLENLPHLQIPATLSQDMLHPNMLGYQIIADEVIKRFAAVYDRGVAA